MEIEATDASGKIVRGRVRDFAEENAQEGERFIGVGRSPAHARYANKAGQVREVDLRELASQANLTKVKFNFDVKSAKDQGLFIDQNIDQGIAYNVERIKSDAGRRKYLTDKGFKNVFNNGDDYFAITDDGKLTPINNRDGFDLSDLTRLGAGIGRDVGATAATIATGVGAAATGGAALAVVGTAAAGGAVLGELAQRAVDKAIGVDAAKYNKEMSGAEEIVALGKTAATGAIGGVAGQVLSKGVGLVSVGATKGVAAITQELGSQKAAEFTSRVAARTEAGYIASTLPGSWLQKAGSAEEAKAMEILSTSLRPEKTTQAIKDGIKEAKTEIAIGRAKDVKDPVELASQMSQRELQIAAKNKAASEEAKRIADEEAKSAFDAGFMDRSAARKENIIETSKIVFGKKFGKEVEAVFDPTVDSVTASKAAKDIESAFIDNLKKKTKVSIDVDSANNIKIDDISLQKYTTKVMRDQTEEVAGFADKLASAGFEFEAVPSEAKRNLAGTQIKSAISKINEAVGLISKDEYKGISGSLNRLKNAIDNHNEVNGDDVAFTVVNFLRESRAFTDLNTLPPSVHSMLRNLNDVVFSYAQGASKNPRALDQAYAAHSKVLDVKDLMRNEIYGQDGGVQFMLGHFDELGRLGGDSSGAVSSEVASLWGLKLASEGKDTKAVWANMSDIDRNTFSAFFAVRNHERLVQHAKAIEQKERSGISVAGEVALAAAFPALYATAKGGKAAIKYGAPVAKAVGKGVIKAAKDPRMQNLGISYGVRNASASEEFIANKLQKFTGTRDTEE